MASQPATTTALSFPTREECVLPELLAARAESTPDKPFAAVRRRELELRAGGTGGVACGERADTARGRDGRLRLRVGAHGSRRASCLVRRERRGSRLRAAQPRGEGWLPRSTPSTSPGRRSSSRTISSSSGSTGSTLRRSRLSLWSAAQRRPICRGGPSRSRRCSPTSRDHRPELPRPVEPWDDLSLIYTSGTTGPSKGVRAAYAAFWNYANCFILPFVDDDDRYLQPLPMFHTAGTGITYSMLQAGGSLALNEGVQRPTAFWDDVRRFEATITIAILGDGHRSCSTSRRRARRRRQPAARRVHGAADARTTSSPSASACRSTPRTA